MIDPRAIEDILIETQSTPGDTSVNLDNQKCLIGHNAERLKHSTRTVYRVCWSDEGNLIGSLLLQGSWSDMNSDTRRAHGCLHRQHRSLFLSRH